MSCGGGCGNCNCKSVCPHTLDFHTDVAPTTPDCDDVLIYNCETGKWGPGQVELWDLDGICIDEEELVEDALYFLQWTGTCFNVDTPNLDDLTDVTLTSPTNGQGLLYNGTVWVNSSNPPAHTLGFHSNVADAADSPSTGNLLRWSGTEWAASNTLPAHTHTLGELSNVADTVDSATSGYFLTYNGTAWVATAPASVSLALDDLTDVTAPTPSSGQVLQFNGTNWVNATLSGASLALDDLTDVTAPTPSSGQVLTWNGTAWVPQTPSGGGGGTVIVGAVEYLSPSGPWTVRSGSGFTVSDASGGTITFTSAFTDAAVTATSNDGDIFAAANITSTWVFGLGSPPPTVPVIIAFAAGE